MVKGAGGRSAPAVLSREAQPRSVDSLPWQGCQKCPFFPRSRGPVRAGCPRGLRILMDTREATASRGHGGRTRDRSGGGNGFPVLSDSFVSGSCSGLLSRLPPVQRGATFLRLQPFSGTLLPPGSLSMGPVLRDPGRCTPREVPGTCLRPCVRSCRSFFFLNRHFGKGRVLRVHV